ncbi:glycogen synthase GlgA [Clostridium sp. UBA1652]|uniref:glycogen synthase GlgA n=1 Tax=Clostridium sp. UBA1652 TaxID=1946348 RepID=UPI00257D307A|nr:glycogen synthase GlgA [Clostridium sp. UBA1652]
MKILFVTSEADPFIKTGGLGDVAGALPKELNKEGVDIRVILPKYKDLKNEYKDKLRFVKWFMVQVGWRRQYCGIFEYDIKGVRYYFIDNEQYFSRDGLYGYYDDGERFAFFDRAVVEAMKELEFKPDVVHCNDWQSGLIPMLLKLEYSKDSFYSGIKSVYSIHNLLFKGVFDPNILPELFGYDMEPYNNGSIEFNGGVSFMKGGINYSDKVSTVSSSYAEEIQTEYYGEGLDGLLRSRNHQLIGILNGIDYESYDPETDKSIYENYSFETINKKSLNKKLLQSELNLPVREDVPMISIISRLTSQKGIDLVIDIADRILKDDVQLVILGTGDSIYEEHFRNLHYRYPEKVSTNIKFNDALAHKIYAASDIFFMPSLFEPCGLGQLIALRYGTIPVVRETGGLKDTVIPYNKYEGTGRGFTFKNFNSNEFLEATTTALECFKNKEIWTGLVREAMNADNSWTKSAKVYLDMYKDLVNT